MTVFLDDGDVKLFHGDVVTMLRQLPAGVAQTCVTSPPYWGLRDYGTGAWTGGDDTCDHVKSRDGIHRTHSGDIRRKPQHDEEQAYVEASTVSYGAECGRCGARRVDSQLGLEPTPELYVERMVAVFREVWRVLRDDGSVWLNLGDSYTAGHSDWSRWKGGQTFNEERRPALSTGLKPKDLVGIPWRVAFALQADGWYLRSDIIWSKPNPMPESVTDRPTKAHEYLFLLTKQPRYFYDADAIREPADCTARPETSRNGDTAKSRDKRGAGVSARTTLGHNRPEAGRNRRSVWTIPTEPFPEAHFATYPQALVRPCILAGTSERGECSACGAPWIRETSTEHENPGNRTTNGDRSLDRKHETAGFPVRLEKRTETTGWRATCTCHVCDKCGLSGDPPASDTSEHVFCGGTMRPAPTLPQTVLDPFIGSGTTALVARNHGRRCIGIDLSAEYLAIAARRLSQLSLLAVPS